MNCSCDAFCVIALWNAICFFPDNRRALPMNASGAARPGTRAVVGEDRRPMEGEKNQVESASAEVSLSQKS